MFTYFKTPIGSTKLGLVINIILFVLKIFAGIFGRSQALLADALNSLLDIVANIVVWLGIRIAERPPDKDHPYGHGNADNLAAVFVAIVLTITGIYIGSEAIDAIIHRNYQTPTWLATAAAIFTIIVKFGLYKLTDKVGKEYNSPAVLANAQDHRSDALISTSALFGIVVAQLGVPILDPIAGVWIALLILKQAIKILRENVQTLMVTSPGSEFEKQITEFIHQSDGVRQVNWVRGRIVGSGYYVDIAIEVDASLTVLEGHDIAKNIRKSVNESFSSVRDVLIHINPYTD